jgi:hypothetical protein
MGTSAESGVGPQVDRQVVGVGNSPGEEQDLCRTTLCFRRAHNGHDGLGIVLVVGRPAAVANRGFRGMEREKTHRDNA